MPCCNVGYFSNSWHDISNTFIDQISIKRKVYLRKHGDEKIDKYYVCNHHVHSQQKSIHLVNVWASVYSSITI